MFYVGIDIAKQIHTVAVSLEDGTRQGKCISFKNNDEGFNKLLNYLNELKVDKQNCIIAMESTGHYWIALYSFLLKKDYPVALINPIQTSAFRKASTVRKTKTDIVDAFLIADFARFKHLEPTSVSPEIVPGLKHLTRYRTELVEERTRFKNKAIAISDRIFPELIGLLGSISNATTKAVMKEYPTPKIVIKTDIRTLTKTIKEASHGRLGRKTAEKLKSLAKKSVGVSFDADILADELKSILSIIDKLDDEIKKMDVKIADKIKDTVAELLLTIPGVGPINASSIIAEIGVPENFKNVKKLIAFAGIDCTKSQSGQFESERAHMSKRGSGYLRYALMYAADQARRHDSYFGDYYDSMKARGKHHFVALSGVARKLAAVILVILKEQRPYEPRPSIQSVQAQKLKEQAAS